MGRYTVQRGFHDIGRVGGALRRPDHVVGWANQRGEKPVAKLQPTTCVISQICGDKQPIMMTVAAWCKVALKEAELLLRGLVNCMELLLLLLQYFQDVFRLSVC